MKFNISGLAKLFVMCFVMMIGFFFVYALILGVPTTTEAVLLLTLLAGLSVFGFCLWCKGD